MDALCPFCRAPLKQCFKQQAHYVCGARVFGTGLLKKKGDACDYIMGLHQDVEKLLMQTKEQVQEMLAEQLPEWVQR